MMTKATQDAMIDADPTEAALQEVEALRAAVATLESELAGAIEWRESAAAEALELRRQLEGAQAYAGEAATKYRQARLAAAPDVPPELVPETTDITEIDHSMEAALRVVTQVQERVQRALASEPPRVPAGSPARRTPDLSSLSAAEKIRVGLERLADHNGR